jgi:Subtilase family
MRRSGLRHRRFWRVLGVSAAALGIFVGLSGGPAKALSTPGSASPAPTVTPDRTRPDSCPAPNGDPNTANDGARPVPEGTFPWPAPARGSNPENYGALHTTAPAGLPERPANWANGGSSWKLTSARTTNPTVADSPQELCGVEGNSVDRAWESTTGRPDTVIAITDSGIEWCSPGIADKIYLNRAALPYPENAAGLTKPELEAQGAQFADSDPYDLDGSGVLNAGQYAHDPRVGQVVNRSSSKGFFCGSYITAEDLIRTFGSPKSPFYYPTSNPQTEAPAYPGPSPAGFTEAIAGWNFVDNTNDPYDDVQYGHGTGEAFDATGAADSTAEVGACPDCMVMPVRVGESFIAEGNDFARGVLFAVDSGASVLQEALGSLDVTTTAAQAIAYANAHGVPVIASAADEEAEHHNEPGNLPGTIVVNSVTQSPSEGSNGVNASLDNPPGYLFLNGCTNYGGNVGVSVESASCSSEATGKTGGITGLIESEARNLMRQGKLAAYPGLSSVGGQRVALSPTEVRELIEMSADDVDFQTAVVPSGTDAGTTSPEPPDNYAVVSPVPTTRYPTQPGYDMYTGYGRMNAGAIMSWLAGGTIPPEASLGEMQWFQTYDPASTTVPVPVVAAADRTPGTFHWELQYGIGTQPEPANFYDLAGGSGTGGPAGKAVSTTVDLSPAQLARIAASLPASTNGTGPDGRPDADAPAFTLRLVVTDAHGLVGMDRRTEYLVHDPTLLTAGILQPSTGPGTAPVTQPATSFGGSVDAAPTLAPIGPGGSDAAIVATADGVIHAYVPSNGGLADLPGWPVNTNELPGQAEITSAERAYTSHQVTAVPHCSIVGGVAAGSLTGSKSPDIVASDICGYVYAWDPSGRMLRGFPVHTNAAFSADPAPFAGTASATDPSVDPRDPNNRLLPGILAAPALADLNGSGTEDIVVSSLDRHVYAWDPSGHLVPGYPVLVVDPAQVQSVDPVTNHVGFKPGVNVQMGSMILDTPAVGRLSGGKGAPDLVVGTDEEYGCNPATVPGAGLQEDAGRPPCAISEENAVSWGLNAAGASLLNPANSRVYALDPRGNLAAPPGSPCAGRTAQPSACAILPGWPASLVDLDAGLLPDVGDGTTGSPALADLSGNGQLDVGAMTAVGPGYIFTPSGRSYYGSGPDGQPVSLSVSGAGPLANSPDVPTIDAVGQPTFASLGTAAPGVSFIAPTASLGKALDAALPDQQTANDNQVVAWNTTTATMQPAFPHVMNDLQFFNQPIVADVGGGTSGAYIVEASATSDIRAVDGAGQEAPGFPKFTGGWSVNSPSFGPLYREADQVLVAGTRDGDLFLWNTPTKACAPSGPWPREHHDLSNTNDLEATSYTEPSCS